MRKALWITAHALITQEPSALTSDPSVAIATVLPAVIARSLVRRAPASRIASVSIAELRAKLSEIAKTDNGDLHVNSSGSCVSTSRMRSTLSMLQPGPIRDVRSRKLRAFRVSDATTT